MNSIPHTYKPLEKKPHEIRILTLHPGFWKNEINCSLHKVVLATYPEYEALSYAWGDATDTKHIRLDGHVVEVTSSLKLALRYLRRPSEKLSLWVDALCIDQNNQDEKSHQVGLMESVYKQCSQVNIFLGHRKSDSLTAREQAMKHWRKSMISARFLSTVASGSVMSWDDEFIDDNEADPFALIHHFHENKHLYNLECFSRNLITRSLRFTETPGFLEQWTALRRLLNCSWWFRFWCVQEALLPKQAVVIYGQWRIPLQIVKSAIQNHIRHLTTCCSEAEKLMGFPYYFEPDRLLIESDTIPGSSVRDATDHVQDLEMVLREYRYKDCQDPRDKVYGILGLVDRSMYQALRPDYSVSIREVYTGAMKAIISKHTDGLRFLTGQGFNSSQHDLPSWVRDFSHRPNISVLRHEMNIMQAYNLYRCSPFTTNQVFIENDSYLHLKGVKIDIVAKVGTALNTLDWRIVGSVLESWHHIAGIRILEVPWAHQRQRSFWRTILADTVYEVEKKQLRRCNDHDISEFHSWLIRSLVMFKIGLQPPLKDCFVLAFLAAIYGRAIFVTNRGHIGLSYDKMEEGDEIWALHGGLVPFILRNQQGGPDDFRAMVGDCYLDGYMDGEAYDKPREVRRVVLN